MFYCSEAGEEKFVVSPANHVTEGRFTPEDQASTGQVLYSIWHAPGWWAFNAEDGVQNSGIVDYLEDRGFNQETALQMFIAYLNYAKYMADQVQGG